MPEPVAEVVPRTQIAAVCPIRRAAEVRRLVPAVTGARQRLDDQLEVRLHRLGLPLELASVGVREAGARLRLQLVGGDVLGLERQGLGEVAFELGGALARDPVDEIERDVVESGITKTVDRAPDVVRSGNAIQHVQKGPVEALCAKRHTVDAVSAQKRGELGRHRLRIRLDRDLVRVRQAPRAAARAPRAR